MKLNQFGTLRRADVVLEAARAAGDECMFSPIKPGPNGYVYVTLDGVRVGAHRLVCLKFHGEPDGNLDAAHSCGNRACVNPRHLRWATRAENFADMVAHGTRRSGEQLPNAKVTNAEAIELRRRYRAGEITARDIARITGLTESNAHQLASGRTYREVQQAAGWPS